VGAGRIVSLAETTSLHTVMMRVKAHLGLEQMRVATPEHEDPETLQVTSVAVCPGAGGSLFEEVGEVDLFLTGEMRHHDVLHKTETGASVLLAEHTNSERGYLPILAQGLTQKLPSDCAIHISSRDRDPIQIR